MADDCDRVADLRGGLRRFRIRYLHTSRSHADCAAVADRNAASERGILGFQSVGGNSVLCSGDCRRHFWSAGRLSDRPARPPAHPDVEHFALRRVHLWDRVRYQPRTILAAALWDLYRRLGGICGRDGMARGAIYAPRTTRSHYRLHAGLCLDRRSEEHTSELQSRVDLVCRLLLEKKKKKKKVHKQNSNTNKIASGYEPTTS